MFYSYNESFLSFYFIIIRHEYTMSDVVIGTDTKNDMKRKYRNHLEYKERLKNYQ